MKHWLTLSIVLSSSSAFALDTREPFALGLTDAELYVGVSNLGAPRSATTPFFSGCFGAGLTDRISLVAGYTANADGYLSQSDRSIESSLYGSVGTWGHVSLDLGAALAESEGSMQAGPTFELTLDYAPEQAIAGLYLHGGPTAAGTGNAVDWTWEHGLGGYYVLGDGKQLFVEWTTGYDLGRTQASQAWQRGTLAAGFNWAMAEGFELITEAGVTIPEARESSRFHVFTGFVATLPAAN